MSLARLVPWFTFVPIGLLHGLFVLTYPLNNRGGDAGNYFQMLVEGRSSLVHAGGYPFLVGLPFRLTPLGNLAATAPALFDNLLQATQHGLAVAGLIALFAFVRRIFGALTACITTIGAGTNLQLLGATSSSYPEWLQASLLAAAAWTAGRGFFDPDDRRKLVWYAASVSLFTWCVLTKFNAAVLALMYFLPLWAEGRTIATKTLWGSVMVLVGLGNVGLFLALFHTPSTGTTRLTADTGWVLLTKVQHVYDNQLSPSSGRATKQWLALAAALPMRYDVAGPGLFSHVAAVPDEVRAAHQDTWERIHKANDAYLDALLESQSLPSGFSVGVSLIPVCYYIGLFEGNDLGVKVAREAILANPRPYIRTVAGDIVSAVTAQHRYPLFATPDNMPGLGFQPEGSPGQGYVQLRQPDRPMDLPYGYRTPFVWWPGVRFFGRVSNYQVPATLLAVLIGCTVLVAAASGVVRRRLETQGLVVLTCFAGLAALVVASCMTLEFRWKELCLALPLVWVLAAAGLTWAPLEVRRLLHRVREA